MYFIIIFKNVHTSMHKLDIVLSHVTAGPADGNAETHTKQQLTCD